MKRRAVYQVITEVKSAPTGVDWLMIMAAKKSIQQQKCFQRPIGKVPVSENSEKQVVSTY